MTDDQAQELMERVRRRIPSAWSGDLHVRAAGELAADNGRPAGTPYVDISAGSKLGRMQAMISIGAYAANEPDDWFDCWRRERDEAGRLRWHLRVYDPKSEPQQPVVFADQ